MTEQTLTNAEYDKTASLVLDVAKLAGKIILENGGETYRAEETCIRICTHFGGKNIAVLAITTGIVLSAEFFEKEYTTVARIESRGINLINVAKVNDISRRLESGTLTLNDANTTLADILEGNKNVRFRRLKAFAISAVGTGFAGAFFAVLFGGKIPEFFVALLTGVVVAALSTFFSEKKANGFITSLVLGIVAALIAISASFLFKDFRFDLVIIGSIMPILPGIAMTVAFRDSIRGDLISGVSRMLESIVLAIAIASGVGIIFGAFQRLKLIAELPPETADNPAYILQYFVFCFFACFFFGFLLHCPKKAVVIGALLGSIGYIIYISVAYYLSPPVGFFLGTMAMSIFSELFARVFKTPATVFLTPAIVSLVPGIGLYKSMVFFVLDRTTEGVNMTVTTLINTCAIALAMATTTFVARMIFKNHKTYFKKIGVKKSIHN